MAQCQAVSTGGPREEKGLQFLFMLTPFSWMCAHWVVFQQWLIMHAYSVHLLTVRLEIMSSIKESKTENCGWRLEDNEKNMRLNGKTINQFSGGKMRWGELYGPRREVTRFASPEGNTWVSKAAKEIKFYVSLDFWLGFYVNAILHHAAFDRVITIIILGCTQEWSVTVKEVIHG